MGNNFYTDENDIEGVDASLEYNSLNL